MELNSNKPIGIFDSGVGGLTVAKAIKQNLPNESVLYFGDTAHLPYGDKSKATIVNYSKHITKYLLNRHCKVIVIACNSASSNAYTEVVEMVNGRVPVINVIDPVVEYIKNAKNINKLGVIGTKSTIASQAYVSKIARVRGDISVSSLATPLFVPMIEEGFIFDDISNAIIRAYLSDNTLSGINSLILGCTHYPIIRNQVLKFFDFKVDVIDSAQIVAQYLQSVLVDKQLLKNSGESNDHFVLSDYTENFKRIAKLFFEKEINIETTNLWAV